MANNNNWLMGTAVTLIMSLNGCLPNSLTKYNKEYTKLGADRNELSALNAMQTGHKLTPHYVPGKAIPEIYYTFAADAKASEKHYNRATRGHIEENIMAVEPAGDSLKHLYRKGFDKIQEQSGINVNFVEVSEPAKADMFLFANTFTLKKHAPSVYSLYGGEVLFPVDNKHSEVFVRKDMLTLGNVLSHLLGGLGIKPLSVTTPDQDGNTIIQRPVSDKNRSAVARLRRMDKSVPEGQMGPWDIMAAQVLYGQQPGLSEKKEKPDRVR